jgi:hypothetical protein
LHSRFRARRRSDRGAEQQQARLGRRLPYREVCGRYETTARHKKSSPPPDVTKSVSCLMVSGCVGCGNTSRMVHRSVVRCGSGTLGRVEGLLQLSAWQCGRSAGERGGRGAHSAQAGWCARLLGSAGMLEAAGQMRPAGKQQSPATRACEQRGIYCKANAAHTCQILEHSGVVPPAGARHAAEQRRQLGGNVCHSPGGAEQQRCRCTSSCEQGKMLD